jgi:DtxR family Mn-dependent transcriptional regulator
VSTDDVSAALRRYLEAIYYLEAEGEEPRLTRIAEWLGVSLPTVSTAVGRLVDAGLLRRTPSRTVAFTAAGRRRGARIVRTHRIVERWLTDELGLDWLEADAEAGRLEHAVSEQVAERLFERMGRPTTCPHGNPIPGAAAEPGTERPLGGLTPGERSRVRRVSEVTEHEAPMLLRFLADHGFGLGVPVRVVSTDAGAGALTVEVGGIRRVAMSLDMAQRVWVD